MGSPVAPSVRYSIVYLSLEREISLFLLYEKFPLSDSAISLREIRSPESITSTPWLRIEPTLARIELVILGGVGTV